MSRHCCDHDHGHAHAPSDGEGHGHAHAHSHDHLPTGPVSAAYRRVLWIALVLNAGMAVLEIGGGLHADSASLLADAADFFGDAVNYGLSLVALGMAAIWRPRVAWFKGSTMAVYGAGVLGLALWHAWYGAAPAPATMGWIGGLALVVNLGVALLLYRFREGDANMRSVWLCSRNDAIGNAAVLLAAVGVFGTGTMWPDVVVALLMAGLGLQGGIAVMRQARAELRRADPALQGQGL
jgi:Co/Zn/Cd efflux system component